MTTLVFDIETNGFLDVLDTIHCINIFHLEKNTHLRFDSANRPIDEGVKLLGTPGATIIGHNIIDFDVPAIQKVYPGWTPPDVLDTFIWSGCAWPSLDKYDWPLYRKGVLPASLIGRRSLEAFGYRLGVYKGAFGQTTDWSNWTPEMSDYCEQDVVVNVRLFEKLREKNVDPDQLALEHAVRWIFSRQMRYGVYFHQDKAKELYQKLANKMEELRKEIVKVFPPFYRPKGKLFTPKRSIQKKAGEWVGYVADAPLQKIELTEFNPGSALHISKMLMSRFDWIPLEFTEKDEPNEELGYEMKRLRIHSSTTPTVDDEVLKRLQIPEAKPLAEFQLLKKRVAQLGNGKEAWLKHAKSDTSRIHGAINQFGAVTGRCTHFKPNLAQIPANRSPYGKECRALFGVPDGYKLVGCDAEGLEARCKAHYIYPFDKGKLVKVILEGNKVDGTDIHSANRDILGLKSRDIAKTFYYAFMYGAGALKLGVTLMEDDNYKDYQGDPAKLGGTKKKQFEKSFTGLLKLNKAVQKAAKRGWLKGLDGRKIPIRSPHSALNALFQSAGAVIMKKALALADASIQKQGLKPGKDYEFVLNVHDEFQAEVQDVHGYPDLVGEAMKQGIIDAGRYYKLKCPLDAGYDVGDTWAETH